MKESQKKLALDWMRKVHQLEYAHRFESIFWARLNRPVELIAMAFATVVAFSYQFPAISPKELAALPLILHHDIFVPAGSAIVALLTSIIAFLRPGERSESHRQIGTEYEKLRHEVERIVVLSAPTTEADAALGAFKEKWDALNAPNVSQYNFRRGKQKARSFGKYPEELGFLDSIEDGREPGSPGNSG
jgi:hypothetical protein